MTDNRRRRVTPTRSHQSPCHATHTKLQRQLRNKYPYVKRSLRYLHKCRMNTTSPRVSYIFVIHSSVPAADWQQNYSLSPPPQPLNLSTLFNRLFSISLRVSVVANIPATNYIFSLFLIFNFNRQPKSFLYAGRNESK